MAGKKHIIYDWQHQDFSRQGSGFDLSRPEPFETFWQCPPQIGQGYIRRFLIHAGFELWTSNCRLNRGMVIDHNRAPEKLFFIFVLSGGYSTQFGNTTGCGSSHDAGQAVIWYQTADASYHINIDTPLRYMAVMIDPELFAKNFKEDLALFPLCLKQRIEGSCRDEFFYTASLTPAMHQAMEQILCCPFTGIARKMFIEARSMELMALQLHGFVQQGQLPAPAIHPQDLRAAEAAKLILIEQMATPPDLQTLAHSTGMSRSKLTRCFKRQYGMSVFQYLRHIRLETARQMIIRDKLSITEAAFKVGYDSLSHFSQAYKKQFGVSPRNSQSMIIN